MNTTTTILASLATIAALTGAAAAPTSNPPACDKATSYTASAQHQTARMRHTAEDYADAKQADDKAAMHAHATTYHAALDARDATVAAAVAAQAECR